MTLNDFFILKIICSKKFHHPAKTLDVTFLSFFFSFFKNWFFCEMVKQRNFLHVADLLFDARFVKYDQYILHYLKQCPTTNIKEKFSHIGQNVSNIFWICSWQIVFDKLSGLLISDFIILVMWLWSFDNHGESHKWIEID